MDFEKILQERRAKKSEKIRKKNNELRKKGIEPIKKGWGKMVDTGMSGSSMTNIGKGIFDPTGDTESTSNFYSEEQKRIAEEIDRKNQNKN